MQKKVALLFGVTLVALALLMLVGNLLTGITDNNVFHTGFHTWPLAVIGVGLLFCVPPIIFREQKGLGGLFIPGLPLLTTGCLLFVSSITSNWALWGKLWPLEIIGLSLGFVMATIFLRVIWLMLPASIVGLTGLVLLFCSLTGFWVSWAVLWTVIPLSVGLPLLLIGIFQQHDGVKLAGLIVSGFAGLAFTAMSAVIASSSWITKLGGPVIIFLLGVFMIGSTMFRKRDK
jgi:hypothetical protein